MLIAGGNLGVTSYGKRLPDGSLTILDGETVDFSIAEERLSRIKCEGGFTRALDFYLDRPRRRYDEIDTYVLSSCCDMLGRAPTPTNIPKGRVIYCPHHLSHALGSFAWSPFREAIVLVLDSGGDNLDEVTAGRWWKSSREQHSIYYVSQTKHELIERHADGPEDAGFGEMFRAFTYFLGWHGARYSGNTMALSGFGNRSTFDGHRLFDSPGQLYAFQVKNDPERPIEMVQDFLNINAFEKLRPRLPGAPFETLHLDLAAFLQSELERYLEIAIRSVVRKSGIRKIILSGGVAYNCLSLGRLRDRLENVELFVQPASGDTGQGFGNACFGFFLNEGRMPNLGQRRIDLGGRYRRRRFGTIECQAGELDAHDDRHLDRLAEQLVAGKLAVFHSGRSEYGPRALGHRSIISAAGFKFNKRRMNRLKKRNYFMPIAPVTTDESANRFFHCPSSKPWMTDVVKLRPEYSSELSAASHAGGWCRIQTVPKSSSPGLYRILELLDQKTQIPVLLNTSLNGPGEPIVETPKQAFDFFLKAHVDCAWIDGTIYVKKAKLPNNDDLRIERSHYAELLTEVNDAVLDEMSKRLAVIFPDLTIHRRIRFSLRADFIKWIKEDRKQTTIRYKVNTVEVPAKSKLPLYQTIRYEALDEDTSTKKGDLQISRVTYKSFGDLDQDDARRDGFKSIGELFEVLREIYGPIADDEIVTIYEVKF
jgi:carbamoyltransferase